MRGATKQTAQRECAARASRPGPRGTPGPSITYSGHRARPDPRPGTVGRDGTGQQWGRRRCPLQLFVAYVDGELPHPILFVVRCVGIGESVFHGGGDGVSRSDGVDPAQEPAKKDASTDRHDEPVDAGRGRCGARDHHPGVRHIECWITSGRVGPIDDNRSARRHHDVHRMQVEVDESVTGQRSDRHPGWSRYPVELFMELGENTSAPAEREWWRADKTPHRWTVETVHDEIAVTSVVDLRTRIAVGSDVPHDLSLSNERAPVPHDAKHPSSTMREDLAVTTFCNLRPDRLHPMSLQHEIRRTGGQRIPRETGSVDLRELTATERDAAVRLWGDAGLTRPGNDPVADFDRALAAAQSAVLGLFDDGILAGTVMVGDDGHRGWVYYLAVHVDHRRCGVGAALMAAAENWMLSRGVAKVNLMVRHSNQAALGFYTHLGYGDDDVTVLSHRLSRAPQ